MTTSAQSKKKKILPKAAKRQNFKAALDSASKKYAGTLARLAK